MCLWAPVPLSRRHRSPHSPGAELWESRPSPDPQRHSEGHQQGLCTRALRQLLSGAPREATVQSKSPEPRLCLSLNSARSQRTMGQPVRWVGKCWPQGSAPSSQVAPWHSHSKDPTEPEKAPRPPAYSLGHSLWGSQLPHGEDTPAALCRATGKELRPPASSRRGHRGSGAVATGDPEPEPPCRAVPGLLSHRHCEIINGCCSEVLSLGVIIYTEIDS